MQRSRSTHAAGLSGDDRISLSALVRYLRDAQRALEESGDEDGALRVEQLADFFTQNYNPKDGLKFKTIHLGL